MALGIKKFVQITVPWDVVPRAFNSRVYTTVRGNPVEAKAQPAVLQIVDDYREAARGRFQVLVSFERSAETEGLSKTTARRILPSVPEFDAATEAFRDRYRARGIPIRTFTAWNEPNHSPQPTGEVNSGSLGPKRAGQYYRSLKERCAKMKECTVAGGDFLDRRSLTKSYLDTYLRYAGYLPRTWAYHAYIAGYLHNSERLRWFLKATAQPSGRQSNIWLTEQGPLYNYPKRNGCELMGDEDLRYLLRLPHISTRIKRFYYYAWTGFRTSFDSGLIGPRSMAPRKAYFTYKSQTNPSEPATYTGNPPCWT